MKKIFAGSLLLGALFAAAPLLAQTGNNDLPGGGQYTINSDYNPTLAAARKIDLPASIPAPDTARVKMTYDVQTRLLRLPFKPADLKPLPLPKDNEHPELQNNLLYAGAGNHLSAFVLARYNSGSSGKLNYGFSVDHLSGNHSNRDFQLFSQNHFQVYLDLTGKKVTTRFQGTDDRKVFYFYGYDHSDTALHFTAKDLRRRFNDLDFSIQLDNAKHNAAGIDYTFRIGENNYSDNLGNSENQVSGLFRVQKTFHKVHTLGLGLSGFTDQDKEDSLVQRFRFQFNPWYCFKQEGGFIKVGLTGAQQDQLFYLFPDFDSEKKLAGEKLIYFAASDGGVVMNGLRNLTTFNPFLMQAPALKISREYNQHTGFKGSLNAHLSYNLEFEQQTIRNFALYLPDTADLKKYMVTYDNRASLITLMAEAGWKWNDQFNARLQVCYFNYDLDTAAFAYGHPKASATLGVDFVYHKNLMLHGDLVYLSGIPEKLLNDGTQMVTHSTVNARLSATYNINQWFSAFIRLDNIAGQAYQRWYQYPSYGCTAIAGLGIRF